MNDRKEIKSRIAVWSNHDLEDEDLKKEWSEIINNPTEIKERFYSELNFGTGGIRAKMGVGTNRMNIFTVRRISQGYADYLKSKNRMPSVVIAYDSRNKSKLFAHAAAEVFAANNIQVHIFKENMPTPILSFTIRYLHCSGGVVITASHNPAIYNGYKIYGCDGGQITMDDADLIQTAIKKFEMFDNWVNMGFQYYINAHKISYVDENSTNAYLQLILNENYLKETPKDLSIVYTPLNGTGLGWINTLLKKAGFKTIYFVEEQKEPNGEFRTCPTPNPEVLQALQIAIELCKEKRADVVIANDPDSDRLGVAVPINGNIALLSGNDVGILLMNFICSQYKKQKRLTNNSVVYTTIVSTDMAEIIANKYGIKLERTLTGFKYIGQKIQKLDDEGKAGQFVFGFEESDGYLANNYVRDKDGIEAAFLVCQMAQYYKAKGKTLPNVLNELYEEYGYFITRQASIQMEGYNGIKKCQEIMNKIRNQLLEGILSLPVKKYRDYKKGVEGLPPSDVVEILLNGQCRIVIRPSGTEPKIKIYISSWGRGREQAVEKNQRLETEILRIISNQ